MVVRLFSVISVDVARRIRDLARIKKLDAQNFVCPFLQGRPHFIQITAINMYLLIQKLYDILMLCHRNHM